MHRYKLLFLVWLIAFGWANQAAANGRFPRSQRLIRDPGSPERMVLAGTFGLALTRDAGQTWVHTCEAAFADPDAILDPLVGFARDGTLYTGTAIDLRRSDPDICEFDVVLGQPGELVPDFTFDVDGQSVLAIVTTVIDGKDRATIQRSANGTSWEPVGSSIEERSVLTLDVAPSDAQRLYVSALAPRLDGEGQLMGQRGVLLVSEDRGGSWQEFDIPGTSFDAQPFIAAVHPSDPEVVYVRLSAQKLDALQLPVADDALLVSHDAGRTWEELIRQPGKLFAFALSPDAATVLVGFGGPDDTTIGADRRTYGLYRINQGGFRDGGLAATEPEHFLGGISAYCLTWTPEGMYVCLKQFDAGFETGFTDNHAFTQLDEVTPLLLVNELQGPRDCPGSSEAAACADRWETDCQRLLSCSSVPTASAMDGGVEASGGADGAGPTAVGVDASLQQPEGEPVESTKSSKCSCHFIGASRWSNADSGVLLGWIALGWASRLRRRRAPRANNSTDRSET